MSTEGMFCHTETEYGPVGCICGNGCLPVSAPKPEVWGGGCECWVVPEYLWTTHYGAVEPGSQVEYNPECPQHGEPAVVGAPYAGGYATLIARHEAEAVAGLLANPESWELPESSFLQPVNSLGTQAPTGPYGQSSGLIRHTGMEGLQ